MPDSAGFLLAMGVTGVIISFVLNLLVNSFVLWFTANHLVGGRAESSFKRCLLCALLLWFAIVLAIGIGIGIAYFTLFLLGILVGVFVWYKLSIIAIESALELPEGAFTVLFVYLLSLAALNWLINAIG